MEAYSSGFQVKDSRGAELSKKKPVSLPPKGTIGSQTYNWTQGLTPFTSTVKTGSPPCCPPSSEEGLQFGEGVICDGQGNGTKAPGGLAGGAGTWRSALGGAFSFESPSSWVPVLGAHLVM